MNKLNQSDILKLLYRMYNEEDKTVYVGSAAKFECDIKGEHGLFKERISIQSKDHIMEQVVYELASIVNVKCCKTSCRKVKEWYGAFSRFEIPDGCQFIHAESIFGTNEIFVDKLFEKSLQLTKNKANKFNVNLYQYILFDYITGQHDRHLENLALIKRDRIYTWYPLYDNGICCFSVLSNDTAIEALNKGFFDTRIGTSYEILEALYKYRNTIYKGNILDIVNYSKVNKELLLNIIDRADKYKQLGIRRREATANFIMKQIETIDLLNYRRL